MRSMLIILTFSLLLSACSPSAAEPVATAETIPTETMMDSDMDMTEEAMMDSDMEMTEEAMMDSDMDMTEEADHMMDSDMDMTEEAMMDSDMDMTEEPMDSDMDMTEEAMMDSDMDMAYQGPEWAQLELVNARTGESFRLADLAGKVVFIEPMATWCSNCRTQQGHVRTAMESLSGEEFVFLSLSVETNIDAATLASYAGQNNFPQMFAVATPEMLNALVGQFGRTISNPPSTPHFIIAPDGTVSALSTGIHSAEEIAAQVRAAQGGS